MIPSEWPDIEAWAITYLTALMSGVTVTNEKPGQTLPSGAADSRSSHPYKHLIVEFQYGGNVTEITRQGLLTIEGWATYTNGHYHLTNARALVSEAALHIQNFPLSSGVVDAAMNSGPHRVRDNQNTGMTYYEAILSLDAHRI